jgi:2-C-methyl-D-erythritol 4-phosphate cytidylyltransferase
MQAAVPKQYLPLRGQPILVHTLARLGTHLRIDGVYVGIGADDPHWPAVAAAKPPKLKATYPGGATRAESVLNGLRRLQQEVSGSDWVLVHDAVRPCVSQADIDQLINRVLASGNGGLLALPLTDTLKRADDNGRVLETVPRERLWRALTPQMFRVAELALALDRALADGAEVTDEAAAMERQGHRPLLVAGSPDNIKITLPQDLALAEVLLSQQEQTP